MRPKHRRLNVRKNAFSLVELVVVIGIIAFLIGLLLPTLSVAREQSRATQCASNLRQLGVAFNIYANAWGGRLPTWADWYPYPHGPMPTGTPQSGWMEQLAPYYVQPNSAVYNCPAFPEGNPMNYFICGRWTGIVSAANGTTNHSIKLTDIKVSSRFVISGDCTCGEFYNPGFGWQPLTTPDCDKDDATWCCLAFQDEPRGINIHRRGNNVLFDDGHVKLYSRFEPSEMTYNPHRMQDWTAVTP